MIETYAGEKFLWMPYSALNIATIIPQWVHAEAHMWCINTPALNFSTVEWYNGDRVKRQFGCRQFMPVEPKQFNEVHVVHESMACLFIWWTTYDSTGSWLQTWKSTYGGARGSTYGGAQLGGLTFEHIGPMG
ncbi:hypothetical protein PVK06_015588 [Gossypium arboreum]|uniref:Aminotransferase-like plant mobile domain-containing protein n=1 Tax=Gossypium arboreum TaxID=29729 RepID=A0ABR0PXM1_GOSAR|nr:hypothetical protein PVK06_015588 [Gossypium arboreum]